jgi:diguanylate cyclase (GGDEF)-like protein
MNAECRPFPGRAFAAALPLSAALPLAGAEAPSSDPWCAAAGGAVLLLLAVVVVLLVALGRARSRASAELAVAYSRMEEQARSDALTSVANRRAATERLELERRRTERTHRPLSLVMLDVDDLKKVNDEAGHACGDAVLKGLAELLRSTLRQLDLVARWGGEEFLLILPETNREGALQIAEKIRKGTEEIRILDGGKKVSFTVTIGVGTFDDLLDVDGCLRRVEAALGEGKRAGKNRVVAA